MADTFKEGIPTEVLVLGGSLSGETTCVAEVCALRVLFHLDVAVPHLTTRGQ